MEKYIGLIMESHGKSKYYEISWKSKKFTQIRAQNIFNDVVVSKADQWWISHEKFAGIPNAEMVIEIAIFTLIYIQNIVTDIFP